MTKPEREPDRKIRERAKQRNQGNEDQDFLFLVITGPACTWDQKATKVTKRREDAKEVDDPPGALLDSNFNIWITNADVLLKEKFQEPKRSIHPGTTTLPTLLPCFRCSFNKHLKYKPTEPQFNLSCYDLKTMKFGGDLGKADDHVYKTQIMYIKHTYFTILDTCIAILLKHRFVSSGLRVALVILLRILKSKLNRSMVKMTT